MVGSDTNIWATCLGEERGEKRSGCPRESRSRESGTSVQGRRGREGIGEWRGEMDGRCLGIVCAQGVVLGGEKRGGVGSWLGRGYGVGEGARVVIMEVR